MKTLTLLLLAFASLALAATTKYTYDDAGRLIKADYGDRSITYSYDKAGNLLSRVVSTGPSVGGVISQINVAWGGTDIAPNTFIEIKGTNLVPANTPAGGVIWSTAPEFQSGRMPTNLGGVSVTINGKPAYIYYYCSAKTSPCATDQINVLTGLDNATGPVQVVVKSGADTSAPFTVTMKALAPAFLLFNPQGYAVATHANFSLLGPTSLYPGATTPAAKGETVVIYAVGFGLPSNSLTEGAAAQSAVLNGTACTLAGAAAPVSAALIAPGLYQLNVTVPANTASGDRGLICTYGGATTPQALLAVQ